MNVENNSIEIDFETQYEAFIDALAKRQYVVDPHGETISVWLKDTQSAPIKLAAEHGYGVRGVVGTEGTAFTVRVKFDSLGLILATREGQCRKAQDDGSEAEE